ncbi:hypothetical protein CcaCcLH18_05201 [Colletotrichum camelliae]|nr:hypothetical protein CcaCcLH18_05201 [Colletotrichum camelliae]
MDDQAAQNRSPSTAAVAPDSSRCRRQCTPDMQSLGLPPHIMAMLAEEDLSALASAKASVERCCSTKNLNVYYDRVFLSEEIGLLKEQWFRCQEILAEKMDEKGSWDVEWMYRVYEHLYDEPPYVGVVDLGTVALLGNSTGGTLSVSPEAAPSATPYLDACLVLYGIVDRLPAPLHPARLTVANSQDGVKTQRTPPEPRPGKSEPQRSFGVQLR